MSKDSDSKATSDGGRHGQPVDKAKAEPPDYANLGSGYVVADRYRVERLLGEGGMGAVYEATHLALDRRVALKLMHAAYAFEERQRKRFIREARVASKLKHPAAVEVYDFGRAEGGLFLVMELLDGFTLADFLDLGLPPLSQALLVIRQMCFGLSAAHEISLVHRDLKPENVFLVDKDPAQLKLVDFGLAFIEGDAGPVGRVTKDAMVSGTPAFVAPETAQALHIGPPADMYAVGVIAFLLLTGELPFDGTAAAMISAHVYQAAPRLQDKGGAVSQDLEDLVAALLEKDPAKRPTADETIACLDAMTNDRRTSERGLIDRVRSGTQKLGIPSGVIVGRDARVLPELEQDVATADYDHIPPAGRRLMAFSVRPDQEMLTALGMRAIDVVVIPLGEPWSAYADVDVVVVDEAAAAEITEIRVGGTPILCTVKDADPAKMSTLIRSGVDDVLIEPVQPHDLARKVGRAIEKAARRRGKPKT